MTKALALLTLFLACTTQPDYNERRQALGGTGDCVVNSTPDDGIDDQDAIQAALDERGCALLDRPGVWDVVGKLGLSRVNGRFDALQLLGGQSIRCASPAVRLAFSGDADGNDWRGIAMYGDDNLIEGCLIDTSGLVNTEEQSHAVHLTDMPVHSGPSHHNTIRGNIFYHPQRGGTNTSLGGGDCIKAGGYSTPSSTGASLTISLEVSGNHFVDCDRSGVASIGGFRGLVIKGNIFYQTGDQDLDIEGNNDGEDLVVSGNVFQAGVKSGGGFAVSLAAPNVRRAVFSDNVLNGRGLFVGGAKRLVISGNVIEQKQSGAPALQVIKNVDEVIVVGNTIVRLSTALPQQVVTFTHHNSGSPGTILFSDNLVRSETTTATTLNIQSALTVTLVGNRFEWAPPSTPVGTTALVSVTGAARRTEALVVTGNMFSGPVARPIQWHGKNAGMGAVTLTGNTAIGATGGAHCQEEPTGVNPLGPQVSSGNNWPAYQGSCTFSAGI